MSLLSTLCSPGRGICSSPHCAKAAKPGRRRGAPPGRGRQRQKKGKNHFLPLTGAPVCRTIDTDGMYVR
ncbi:hypothetical protein HMPREF0262_01501 [Clostridium sp. ATCC 29733]|nr:hypothetical protein HMPREF0262_01501 [Clostridium sp. ATCC 29733]